MSLSRFVYKNMFRNKKRTLFTVISIGFSLFLLIALWTFLDQLMNPPDTEQAYLRLITSRTTSIADQIPISYVDKIKRVPHVARAMPLQWFGGIYKEPKNFFANFAVDPEAFWYVFPESGSSEETKKAFIAERTGAVVGTNLLKRYDWKVGDKVTLLGTIFPVDLEFTIVGEITHELALDNFYFRFDYFNEAMGEPNTTGSAWFIVDSPESIPEVIDTIDGMFRNTMAETKTQTEKAFVLGFVSMIGNIKVLITSIASVVVFTMLLVTASTMAMTIRERMKDVAILKAIGYTRKLVLALILGEAVTLGLLGFLVAVGLCLGLGKLDLYTLTQGMILFFRPPLEIYLTGLLTGAGIGLFAGLWPALQASNMTILEAMRRLE